MLQGTHKLFFLGLLILKGAPYNDMLNLCEKFAPLDGLRKYDPQKDPALSFYS